MEEQQDRRITWTTRINVRPQSAERIKLLAQCERISVATMIGIAIEKYITARSTA